LRKWKVLMRSEKKVNRTVMGSVRMACDVVLVEKVERFDAK
jgi:hypothetical protein